MNSQFPPGQCPLGMCRKLAGVQEQCERGMGAASAHRCLPGWDGLLPQTLPTTEPDTRHASSRGVAGKLVLQVTQETVVAAQAAGFPVPQDLVLRKPKENLQLNEGVRRVGSDDAPRFVAPPSPLSHVTLGPFTNLICERRLHPSRGVVRTT